MRRRECHKGITDKTAANDTKKRNGQTTKAAHSNPSLQELLFYPNDDFQNSSVCRDIQMAAKQKSKDITIIACIQPSVHHHVDLEPQRGGPRDESAKMSAADFCVLIRS
jgi:hypothetical protein